MDNGLEVMAKIPSPNAGRPHLTTASEVAIMQVVKKRMGTPVPTVLAWSSNRSNPVGAEYIIMGKAAGVELETILPKLSVHERLEIVKNISTYQKSWAQLRFESYESVYHSDDLPAEEKRQLVYHDADGTRHEESDFCLGPTTGRDWFDDGRGLVDFDIGPWEDAFSYHRAIGERERNAILGAAELPKSPIAIRGPGLYRPTREKKLRAVDAYMAIFQRFLPQDQALLSGCLWHNDLHEGNIFVDPSEPYKVTGLIDWQVSEVAPLVEGTDDPELPEGFNDLDADTKAAAENLFLKQALCILWRQYIVQLCPPIYKSIEFQEREEYLVLLVARNLLVEGEAAYMGQLLQLRDEWSKDNSTNRTPFPLQITDEEKESIVRDCELWNESRDVMRSIQSSIGELFPEKGIVRHDQYAEAKNALWQMREQCMELYVKTDADRKAWMEEWPFDC